LDTQSFVQARVKHYYWEKDLNCAGTTLLILAEIFGVALADQVMDAAVGMHGAGGAGAQCGLVEGTLMFLGIIGRRRGIPNNDTVDGCQAFAQEFAGRFTSLQCAVLRPEGFAADNPPHLCEGLSGRAINFSVEFIRNRIGRLESAHPLSR